MSSRLRPRNATKLKAQPGSGPQVTPSRIGFFHLPLEVRQLVYFLVLRPDCHRPNKQKLIRCGADHEHVKYGDRNPAHLMTLCKAIYLEARPYQSHMLMWLTAGFKKKIIRDPLDCPRPDLLDSLNQIGTYWRPPLYTELQLLRATILSVEIDLLWFRGQERRWDKPWPQQPLWPEIAAQNIWDIVGVVQRSKDLRRFRLVLWPLGAWMESHCLVNPEEAEPALWEAVETLIKILMNKNIEIELLANENLDAYAIPTFQAGLHIDRQHYDAQSLRALRGIADSLEIPLRLHGSLPNLKEGSQVSIDGQGTADDVQGIDMLQDGATEDSEGKVEARDDKLSFLEQSGPLDRAADFKHLDADPDAEYRMIIECRRCLTPFATKTDLNEHLLQRKNHHQARWIKHEENPIGPCHDSFHGNCRWVCRTCGQAYSDEEDLKKHLRENEHARYGLIPRYVKDNIAYDRKAKAFFERRYHIVPGHPEPDQQPI